MNEQTYAERQAAFVEEYNALSQRLGFYIEAVGLAGKDGMCHTSSLSITIKPVPNWTPPKPVEPEPKTPFEWLQRYGLDVPLPPHLKKMHEDSMRELEAELEAELDDREHIDYDAMEREVIDTFIAIGEGKEPPKKSTRHKNGKAE